MRGTLADLLLLTVGCTTNIKLGTTQNPPSKAKSSDFNRFALHPLQTANRGVAEQNGAFAKIQENLHERLRSQLNQWNAKRVRGATRTLVIEPIVAELKFTGCGTRFFAGAMHGLQLRGSDADAIQGQGYSRAAGLSGAFRPCSLDGWRLVGRRDGQCDASPYHQFTLQQLQSSCL